MNTGILKVFSRVAQRELKKKKKHWESTIPEHFLNISWTFSENLFTQLKF